MIERGVIVEQCELLSNELYLRIDFDFTIDNAHFFYSYNGKDWTKIGTPLKMVYNLVHFMGYRFAIFNYATQQSGGYIDVDNFIYSREKK